MPRSYRTGVSLHSHTNHSREGLKFIQEHAEQFWAFRIALAGQNRKAVRESNIEIDFRQGYWIPPLPPVAAFKLEKDQIERQLGLDSLISLTDHDNIEAPMLLRVVPEGRRIPVSLEWTVWLEQAEFHVGVHNLPSGRAAAIMSAMAECTRNPNEGRLAEILQALHEMDDVLVVVNHPLWDLAGLGPERHETILRDLLCKYGQFVHALEMNGMRSWRENQQVLQLSRACNQLVISGGDRHGCEPNACLNLTNTQNFSEFVHEVRRERVSHLLFMPQYTEPFALRVFQTILDTTREYPDYSIGSRHWDERVFHPDSTGAMRPLSMLWTKPPGFIKAFLSAVSLLEIAPVRKTVLAIAKPRQDVRFGFETLEVTP